MPNPICSSLMTTHTSAREAAAVTGARGALVYWFSGIFLLISYAFSLLSLPVLIAFYGVVVKGIVQPQMVIIYSFSCLPNQHAVIEDLEESVPYNERYNDHIC